MDSQINKINKEIDLNKNVHHEMKLRTTETRNNCKSVRKDINEAKRELQDTNEDIKKLKEQIAKRKKEKENEVRNNSTLVKTLNDTFHNVSNIGY